MPLSTLTNIYFSYFHSVMSYGIIFQETSSHSHSIFSLAWLDLRFYPFLIGLEGLVWESRGIALLLSVYLGTRWGWVVSTTPRPPCPRYQLFRRLGGPRSRSGQVRKISTKPGFDPRTFENVVNRYTDYDISAPLIPFLSYKKR